MPSDTFLNAQCPRNGFALARLRGLDIGLGRPLHDQLTQSMHGAVCSEIYPDWGDAP